MGKDNGKLQHWDDQKVASTAYGGGRLIAVLFTVLCWQRIRDFDNWSLDRYHEKHRAELIQLRMTFISIHIGHI